MNQNEKHISARIWDSRGKEYKTRVVPNYSEFINNVFNLKKYDFVFSRSSRSKHLLGGMRWL